MTGDEMTSHDDIIRTEDRWYRCTRCGTEAPVRSHLDGQFCFVRSPGPSCPADDDYDPQDDARPDVWHITNGRDAMGRELVLCGIEITWGHDNMTPKNPDKYCPVCQERDG